MDGVGCGRCRRGEGWMEWGVEGPEGVKVDGVGCGRSRRGEGGWSGVWKVQKG